ncbi:MAG: polymerase sigma factor FliA [Humisphaera sp.]|nr:polymerase sigma factor FliA [Humisphaera sp.]
MQPQSELVERYVAAMWQEYVSTRSPELRDCLFEFYLDLGLVRRAAKRMARSLPQQVDPDELLSAGGFGLLAAVERFDPARAIKFTTFSQQPIRGAMLDYLREIDHLSRAARTQANKLIAATERLRMKLGRPPGDEEVRRLLDVSRKTLRSMSCNSRAGSNLSLDHRNRTDASGLGTIEALAAEEGGGFRSAMKHDVRDWIVQGLSRRHRLIIVLYYYEDMTMREIGQTLKMSESRVSQLHAIIIERLQKRLRHRDGELVALSA